MKKYLGIIGATVVALTLTGCGNHNQSKSSDTKVKTQKVVKASHHKKTAKKTTKQKTATKSATSTAFSGQGYVSSWIDSVSGIFFKGDQFIWKYTSPVTVNSDNTSSATSKMMIMQGTYNYDSSSKVITLNIANQSKTYTGRSMNLDKYQYESVAAPSAPSTVKMQFNNDNGTDILEILNGDFVNFKLQNAKPDSKLNYDNILNQYSVSKVDSSMQEKAKGIESADDFKQFMLKYNFMNENKVPVEAFDGNGQISSFDVYSEGDYDDAIIDSSNMTPEKTVHAKYTVTPDTGMTSDMYFLGDDNNIYYGLSSTRPEVKLAPEANSKYHQVYGN